MNKHLCRRAIYTIIALIVVFGIWLFAVSCQVTDEQTLKTTNTTELAFSEIPISRFQQKISRGEKRAELRSTTTTSQYTNISTTTITTKPSTNTTELRSSPQNSFGYGNNATTIPSLLRRIGGCESTGRADGPLIWTAKNRKSSASGAFQYLDSTWNKYRGYVAARYAPPEIQVERAVSDFQLWQRRGGNGPWYSSRSCWG